MLIKFKGQASSSTIATEALKAAVRDIGELKSLPATTTVKVFDLHSGNTVDQVQEAVKKTIPQLATDPIIALSNPNARE